MADMAVRFIALKRLSIGIGKDGTRLYREIGDEVPEALSWPNPRVWIEEGYIRREEGFCRRTPRSANRVQRNAGGRQL